MFETVIVVAILVIALVLVGRSFYRTVTGKKQGRCCGCSSCACGISKSGIDKDAACSNGKARGQGPAFSTLTSPLPFRLIGPADRARNEAKGHRATGAALIEILAYYAKIGLIPLRFQLINSDQEHHPFVRLVPFRTTVKLVSLEWTNSPFFQWLRHVHSPLWDVSLRSNHGELSCYYRDSRHATHFVGTRPA